MRYKIILQDEAISDIREAHHWYEEQLAGLGDRFIDEIDDCFYRISENPQYYGFLTDKFRRISIKHFPFRIVYETSEDSIIIISVDHTSENKL